MTCAVVEHKDGTRTHHTNVVKARIGMSRQKPYVKLLLIDDSIDTINTGVSVKLVDDEWYLRNQLGLHA